MAERAMAASAVDAGAASPLPGGALPAPEEAAFRGLVRAFGLLRRVMEPFFAGFGISGSQWGVLRTLHRSAEAAQPALRLTELGQRLLVRPPSVTGAVDRLQRMGLVSRATSKADHRARLVSLTAAGRELVARVLGRHRERVRQVMAGLTSDEQAQLAGLLERLGGHVDEMATSEESRPGYRAAPPSLGDEDD